MDALAVIDSEAAGDGITAVDIVAELNDDMDGDAGADGDTEFDGDAEFDDDADGDAGTDGAAEFDDDAEGDAGTDGDAEFDDDAEGDAGADGDADDVGGGGVAAMPPVLMARKSTPRIICIKLKLLPCVNT